MAGAQEEQLIEALAAEQHVAADAVRALIGDLRERGGAGAYYIFWNAGGAGGPPTAPSGRPRRLLAFPSPDAALAFAQVNHMSAGGRPPRLRRLTLAMLLRAMLREPSIASLLLASAEDEPPAAGQLPPGYELAREEALGRLGCV